MISIAIVTHKRPEHLEACLRSCAAQSPRADEIVIALNPADEISESIATRYDAHFVRTHINLGFFPALNIAIANTKGQYVMVMDDDADLSAERCVVETPIVSGSQSALRDSHL